MLPKRLLLVLLSLALFCGAVIAAPDPKLPTTVAYLSLVEGDVAFLRGDDDGVEWSAAAVNVPVMVGDSLYTTTEGRAELVLGEDGALRFGRGAVLNVLQDTPELLQLKLTSGVATVLIKEPGRTYEFNTPALAFATADPGEYRIDVAPNGDSEVTVYEGAGVVSVRGGEDQTLTAPARFKIAAESGERAVLHDRTPDDWDNWCGSRQKAVATSVSRQYVPEGVYGHEVLDQHGHWVQTPQYSWAWVPSVGPEWQPYRDGRWVWVDPYGWTWVSYEPWGWAPYHYGRWVYIGGRGWAWVPGPRTTRQRFAAALVAFIGGSDWFGWVPLGPGEYYDPYYRAHQNVVIVNYVNYQYVTVVNQQDLYSPAPRYTYRRLPAAQLRRASTARELPPPRRESLYVPTTRRVAPPPALQQRTVLARNPRVPVVRPFVEKLGDIHRTGQPQAAFVVPETAASPSRSRVSLQPVGTPGTVAPASQRSAFTRTTGEDSRAGAPAASGAGAPSPSATSTWRTPTRTTAPTTSGGATGWPQRGTSSQSGTAASGSPRSGASSTRSGTPQDSRYQPRTSAPAVQRSQTQQTQQQRQPRTYQPQAQQQQTQRQQQPRQQTQTPRPAPTPQRTQQQSQPRPKTQPQKQQESEEKESSNTPAPKRTPR